MLINYFQNFLTALLTRFFQKCKFASCTKVHKISKNGKKKPCAYENIFEGIVVLIVFVGSNTLWNISHTYGKKALSLKATFAFLANFYLSRTQYQYLGKSCVDQNVREC